MNLLDLWAGTTGQTTRSSIGPCRGAPHDSDGTGSSANVTVVPGAARV